MTSPEKLTCPACGAAILYTDNQCLGCGAHLDEGRLVGTPTGPDLPPPVAPGQDVLDVTLEPEAAPTPAATAHREPPPTTPTPVPYRLDPEHQQAYGLQDAPRGTGFLAGLSRAWEFLKQSLALARDYPQVLMPSLLSILTGLVLVGIYLGAMFLVQGSLRTPEHDHAAAPLLLQLLGAAVAVAGALLTYWFMGMTADLVSAALRGQRPALAHAWGEACRNAGALLWLAIVATAVHALTSSLRRRGGLLGDVVADTADHAWQVASYLLVPIIILEDVPFSQATRRAVQLHRNNVVGIIVGEIAVSWLTGFVSGVLLLAAGAGALLAAQAVPLLMAPIIGALAAWLILIASASGYVRMAYYTCLYEWAAATETAPATAPVPAPAPLAAALARA